MLRIQRCRTCGRRHHPPRPICPSCHGDDLAFEPVSGRATVWSWTLSRSSWGAGLEAPYVVALVALEEDAEVLLLTNIVDCDDVHVGMAVEVRFEPAGDVWVPVFAP